MTTDPQPENHLGKLFTGNGGHGHDPELGTVHNPDDNDYWRQRLQENIEDVDIDR